MEEDTDTCRSSDTMKLRPGVSMWGPKCSTTGAAALAHRSLSYSAEMFLKTPWRQSLHPFTLPSGVPYAMGSVCGHTASARKVEAGGEGLA